MPKRQSNYGYYKSVGAASYSYKNKIVASDYSLEWSYALGWNIYYSCPNPAGDPNCGELCDGKDNTGDGVIDEPPDSTNQKGVCSGSKKVCDGAGGWKDDYSGVKGYESTESSCDGKDNDCDGNTDNLEPPKTENQFGVCAGATKKCAGEAGWINYYEGIPDYQVFETKCDGKDNDCNPATPDPCCEIGEAKFTDSYVYPFFPNKAWIDSKVWLNPLPDYDPGPFSKTTLMIGLKQPSSTQCTVNLSVEPEIGSGGHNHNLASDGRKTGRLSANHVIFMPNETGYKTVKYTAYTASGIENVRLKVSGQQDKIVPIKVMVPGLQELPSYYAYFFSGTETNKNHLGNHYGTWYANWGVQRIALEFYEAMDARLGINDMSLKWGGVFDIDGDWREDYHKSHRKGKSADINRCAVSTIKDNPNPKGDYCKENNTIMVGKRYINDLCKLYGGYIVKEGTIHCEFIEQ